MASPLVKGTEKKRVNYYLLIFCVQLSLVVPPFRNAINIGTSSNMQRIQSSTFTLKPNQNNFKIKRKNIHFFVVGYAVVWIYRYLRVLLLSFRALKTPSSNQDSKLCELSLLYLVLVCLYVRPVPYEPANYEQAKSREKEMFRCNYDAEFLWWLTISKSFICIPN